MAMARCVYNQMDQPMKEDEGDGSERETREKGEEATYPDS
jgi:hypothetical protein